MRLDWIRRVIVIVVVAGLSSSCALYRLQELRQTTLAGTPFQNELARLYMDFATQEEKEYDWFSSMYFAGKGLQLAYGKDVLPEDLSDWNIPEAALPAMEKARADLMLVLTSERMHSSPSDAANAQFYFDCWVEQQEENWQTEDITYCRDNLMQILQSLQSYAHEEPSSPVASPPKKAKTIKKVTSFEKENSFVPVKKPAKALAKEKPATAVAPETLSYVAFFEPNKADLSEPGKAVMGEITSSLKGMSDYEVVLHGSTYKTKKTEDNADLAKSRAETVKKRLLDAGVKEDAIRMYVPDAPEDKPVRHRVEIFLNE